MRGNQTSWTLDTLTCNDAMNATKVAPLKRPTIKNANNPPRVYAKLQPRIARIPIMPTLIVLGRRFAPQDPNYLLKNHKYKVIHK